VTDEVWSVWEREEAERARVCKRRQAQASAMRIAAQLEYRETMRELQRRLREAESELARVSRRKRERAALLVCIARSQLERFVQHEGQALVRATDAIAAAIEDAADPEGGRNASAMPEGTSPGSPAVTIGAARSPTD
jgi:hypothetical protein